MPKCCNNGCTNRDYIEEENTETSCIFHPGGPIFHEGLKGWSCCKKRVIDFNEFLSIKGCTTGKHNPIPMKERNKQPDEENESEKTTNKTENSSSSPKTSSKNEHSIPEMAERDHRNYGKETIKIKQNDFFFNMNF